MASPFRADAGKAAGVEIWRIENMEPAEVPKEQHNQLYSGDCYIVLNTVQNKYNKLEWHLHFWQGKDSSQDERGASALHTINLDDQLGGAPVQYREVEGHESARFLTCFPGGLQTLEGGVASGFRTVDREAFDTRLFWVKGKRNVRVVQVPLSADSLNEGDVFILDAGRAIHQWNGAAANKMEKFKGLEMITKIRNEERGGNADLTVLDSGKNDTDAAAFWSALGAGDSRPARIKSEEEGGSDEAIEQVEAKLFRVSDATGSMEIREEARASAAGGLKKSMLDTNDVFLVDTGNEVFVWVGRGATKEERHKGIQFGADYLQQNNRPDYTPLQRVVESAETPAFKAFFAEWDPPRVLSFGAERKEQTEKKDLDVSSMLARKQEEQAKMVDDGTGSLQIWRIENFAKVEVPKDKYGIFQSGDSYIVLYSYKKGTRDAWMIYYWQGRDSSSDEKAASALFTVELDDALGGDPVQVRVVQGKEPPHFLSLFKGRMIVQAGGAASGFKNRNDTDSYDTDGVSLYHVRGTNALNTRAVQVAEVASSLNSGDCFVLLTPETMFTWNGCGANADEKATADNIASLLKFERNKVTVEEGQEPDEFWTPLGGKGEYPTTKTMEMGEFEPRLFQVSTAKTGSIGVDEVLEFNQDDLINEDVMILDGHDELFVWIGHNSNDEEKKQSLKAAFDYLDRCGRPADTPVFKVFAGAEPPNFTCHFLGWNDSQALDFSDPYAKKLAAMGGDVTAGAEKKVRRESIQVTRDDIGDRSFDKSISYDDLVANKGLDNCDLTKKEMYLSDADFLSVFGMDKAAFAKLPKWKQKSAKQAKKLF